MRPVTDLPRLQIRVPDSFSRFSTFTVFVQEEFGVKIPFLYLLLIIVTSFLFQTGEQVKSMAQGAIDGVKNTLGVGDNNTKK